VKEWAIQDSNLWPADKSQLPQNDKHNQNKDLQQGKTSAYKPAYKENPITAQKQGDKAPSNLPDDVAEIVAVWLELPEHIKAAIKALIQAHNRWK